MRNKILIPLIIGLLIISLATALTVGQIITANQFRNLNISNYNFDLNSSFTKTNKELIWVVRGLTIDKPNFGQNWNGTMVVKNYVAEYHVPISYYKECRQTYPITQCRGKILNEVRDKAIAEREAERQRVITIQQELEDLYAQYRNEWTSGDLGELN